MSNHQMRVVCACCQREFAAIAVTVDRKLKYRPRLHRIAGSVCAGVYRPVELA